VGWASFVELPTVRGSLHLALCVPAPSDVPVAAPMQAASNTCTHSGTAGRSAWCVALVLLIAAASYSSVSLGSWKQSVTFWTMAGSAPRDRPLALQSLLSELPSHSQREWLQRTYGRQAKTFDAGEAFQAYRLLPIPKADRRFTVPDTLRRMLPNVTDWKHHTRLRAYRTALTNAAAGQLCKLGREESLLSFYCRLSNIPYEAENVGVCSVAYKLAIGGRITTMCGATFISGILMPCFRSVCTCRKKRQL